jgi:hypothetical protein
MLLQWLHRSGQRWRRDERSALVYSMKEVNGRQPDPLFDEVDRTAARLGVTDLEAHHADRSRQFGDHNLKISAETVSRSATSVKVRSTPDWKQSRKSKPRASAQRCRYITARRWFVQGANMQWQTIKAAKTKDKIECYGDPCARH